MHVRYAEPGGWLYSLAVQKLAYRPFLVPRLLFIRGQSESETIKSKFQILYHVLQLPPAEVVSDFLRFYNSDETCRIAGRDVLAFHKVVRVHPNCSSSAGGPRKQAAEWTLCPFS